MAGPAIRVIIAVGPRNQWGSLSTVIFTMENIEKALSFAVRGFSDQNYAQSLTFYRFWFDIGQKYYRTPQDGSAIGSA